MIFKIAWWMPYGVWFPRLEKVTFKVKDEKLLESFADAWKIWRGWEPDGSKVVILDLDPEAEAKKARFKRVVKIETL